MRSTVSAVLPRANVFFGYGEQALAMTGPEDFYSASVGEAANEAAKSLEEARAAKSRARVDP